MKDTPVTLKITSSFVDVANNHNLDPYEFAEKLAIEFCKVLILDEVPEMYGQSLAEWFGNEAYVEDIVEAVKKAGIEYLNFAELLAISEAIVYGNGDCPECGDDLDVEYEWDEEGNRIRRYICYNCGYSETEFVADYELQ